MGISSRPLLSALLVALPACVAVGSAAADGGFIPPEYTDLEEPAQLGLLRFGGGQEELTLQVQFQASADLPLASFGWLLALPAPAEVAQGDEALFTELMELTHPYLHDDPFAMDCLGSETSGDKGGSPTDSLVLDHEQVGAYDVTTLAAAGVSPVTDWAVAHGFALPPGAEEVLQDYVDRHWVFLAVRVDLGQELAEGLLRPLQLRFPADRPVFPLRISALNGLGADGLGWSGDLGSEVLLYLAADRALVAPDPGVALEFRHGFGPGDLDGYPAVRRALPRSGMLTKVRFWADYKSLDEDLYFQEEAGSAADALRDTERRAVPATGVVPVAALLVLLAVRRRRPR